LTSIAWSPPGVADPAPVIADPVETAYAPEMTLPARATRALLNAMARVEAERLRAKRAAEIAERHEGQLPTDPPMLRAFHLKMATTHRQVQRQHLAAAAMHAAHVHRLRIWIDTPQRHHMLPPFMAGVADAADADSAALTLFGPGLVETLTAASDSCAKAAQDLEFTLGEGPARDTMIIRRAVQATGPAIRQRWPHYGPAVEHLGIASIATTPVELTGVPLGTLTLFGPHRRSESDSLDRLQAVADTVARILLPVDGPNETGEQALGGALLEEADHRAVVHQATGVVSVQNGCTLPDAFALIRARAFAEDRSIESIATDIVEQTLRLE
jgi:hypothetical protein